MLLRYTARMKWVLISVIVLAAVGGGVWIAAQKGYISLPQLPVRTPSLNREVAFAEDASQEAKDAVSGKVALNQDALKKDNTNIEAWLDLAIQYKQGGDIEGAIEIWEYLDTAFPGQSTSSFNLGVVHHQDLKEYEKSEQYYREAIRRSPLLPLGYLGLHELYRYVYKTDTAAAVDILLEGIKQIPNEVNMPIALAAYYRDKKDYPEAIEYIEKAVTILKDTGGDVQKIQALEGEAVRLGKLQ